MSSLKWGPDCGKDLEVSWCPDSVSSLSTSSWCVVRVLVFSGCCASPRCWVLHVGGGWGKPLMKRFEYHEKGLRRCDTFLLSLNRLSGSQLETDDHSWLAGCARSPGFLLSSRRSSPPDVPQICFAQRSVLQSDLHLHRECFQNQVKLQHDIGTAGRSVGVDQASAALLCNDLILKTADQIINDPAHPLHRAGQQRGAAENLCLQQQTTKRELHLHV